MPKIEKKLLGWIDRNKEILFVLAMAVVSLLLRFPLRNIQMGNMTGKLVATFFDYLLAASVAMMVYFFSKEDVWRKRKMTLAFAAVLFSLNLVFSSAVYGYGDSFLMFLMLWTAMLLLRGRYLPALCLLGLAVGLDLRALLLLPAAVFLYLYRKSFSALYFAVGGVITALLRFGDRLTGSHIAGWFRMYRYAPGNLFWHAPSLWVMFEGDREELFLEYAPSAVVFTLLALVGIGMLIAAKRETFRGGNGWIVILLFTVTGDFLIPGAGEGGMLFAEVLSILVAVFEPKTIPLAVLLNMTDVILYAADRYGSNWMPLNQQELSILVLVVILTYFVFYVGSITPEQGMLLDNTDTET